MPRKKSRIIQVPVPEDLLNQLDKLAEEAGESRSAMIREACAIYIANAEEAELDRQYEETYRAMPVTTEERQWADYGLKRLAEFFAEEDRAVEEG